jgi:acylpyruvate hydrolase
MLDPMLTTPQEGDLVLTGTPSGVGPLVSGDKVVCALRDLESGKELTTLSFSAIDREGGYLYRP